VKTTGPETPTQTPDPLTPSATRDTTNHQQDRVFGTENRANASSPIEGAERKGERGERFIGQGAGSDTTGAVAQPSQTGKPGASIDLDGTPGALAPDSTGRQGNF
jgi:hypothetical protein